MSMEDYALYERDEPALSGTQREIYEAVDRAVPWALVERFADLERVSGSEAERDAATYLADRLDGFGIDHEVHQPELYVSVPETASLSVVTPQPEEFDAVKTVAFSASGRAQGDLVVAGDGGTAEDLDDLLEADLTGLDDVTGRVVLLSGLLPIDAIQELEDRGAAGVVVQHPHEREPHDGIATPVWGGAPEPDEADRVPDIPIVTVARPVGQQLRELDASGAAVSLELSTSVTTGWTECPLVEARIAGDGDDEDFVLLHGHYDSWHVGVADNATGDAGLLECARVLHEHRDQLRRNLRVAWWPAHSTGRYAGSSWYAETFAADLRKRCIAHVNMDSPGAADATEFQDMVDWMPEAADLCERTIDDVAGKDAAGGRPARAGDYSFNNLGISGLFMLSSNIPAEVRAERGYHPVGGCGGNADAWHLTSDTLDKADPDVLVRDIRVYAVALARLLCDPVVPLDHRDTLERHREYLRAYDEAAGEAFDLGPARDALDDLAGAVEELYTAATADAVAPDAANEAIKRLSRRLVRLSFCEAGRFEQDPATPRAPYPRLAWADEIANLDPPERGFARTALRRGRNRVIAELEAAREAVIREL